jgi:hypothetical protein
MQLVRTEPREIVEIAPDEQEFTSCRDPQVYSHPESASGKAAATT